MLKGKIRMKVRAKLIKPQVAQMAPATIAHADNDAFEAGVVLLALSDVKTLVAGFRC